MVISVDEDGFPEVHYEDTEDPQDVPSTYSPGGMVLHSHIPIAKFTVKTHHDEPAAPHEERPVSLAQTDGVSLSQKDG